MRKTTLLFCLLFSLTMFGQTKLTPAEAKLFKEKVEKETQSLQSIRTDFQQSKHLSFLSKEIESKGQMFLNQEGNLKWEYITPNKYSVIFKNDVIYINDNCKKSTVNSKNDIFKNINHLISGSISGKLFNDKDFEIQYYKNGKEIIAQLVPLDKNLKKYISEVNLFFSSNDSVVHKVKLIEPSQDYTEIKFINRETNVKIDSSIFNP